MNSSTLHSIIEKPNTAAKHLDELSGLVKTHPWFSTGQILLAKGMFENRDIHYDDQLHLSAVYAGDRKVLFELIMNAIEDKVEEPKELAIEETKLEKPEVLIQDNVKKETIDSEEEVLVIKKTEEVSDEESIESKELEKETEKPEAEKEISPKRKIEGIEKEILIEAVSSTIEKEVEEDSSELREEERSHTSDENIPSESEPEEETEESYSDYTKWLLKRSKQIAFTEEEKSDTVRTEAKEEKTTEAISQKDILDRFIKTNPHITRGKMDNFSTEKGFKESLVEDESLITETMAQIYAKQGKISKAKKAYKLLSLKYPEKSIYFAGRIKNLEGKK